MKILLCFIVSILLLDCVLQASNAEKHIIKFAQPDVYVLKFLLSNTNMHQKLYDIIMHDNDLHHTILNKVDQINIRWDIDKSEKFHQDQKIGYAHRKQEYFSTRENPGIYDYKNKRDYGYDQDQSSLAFNSTLSSKKAQPQKILNVGSHPSSSH